MSYKNILIIRYVFLTILIPSILFAEESLIFSEPFNSLDKWQGYSFAKIDKATDFKTTNKNLIVHANKSASAIITNQNFTLTPETEISWTWKLEKALKALDGRKKKEDDYALRIYVMFEDASPDETFFESLSYDAASAVSSGELPRSALCYTWASQSYEEKSFESPYTDRVMIVPLRSDKNKLSTWATESVKPYDDYQKFFNRVPPKTFRLVIMGDADNSESESLGHFSKIYITSPKLN